MTIEEWARHNVITGFKHINNPVLTEQLKTRFPLRPLSEDDLYFTDEIEDDRVNVTVSLADYDWMAYTYDARIPTKTFGTISVRFEYIGATTSYMEVHQHLPGWLTGLGDDENITVNYEYSYPTALFNKYLCKDLQARVDEIDSRYAYSPETLILEWFNEILATGTENKETCQMNANAFHWESVRRPKPDDMDSFLAEIESQKENTV